MGADSFFRMGATHRVCQDYAAHGVSNGATVAALSDGCSSSPDTDIGARCLVRALLLDCDGERNATFAAAHWIHKLGLPKESLDATLLHAVYEDGAVTVRRAGDGVIVIRGRDNVLHYATVHYDGNAPRYPRHKLSAEMCQSHARISPGATFSEGKRESNVWTMPSSIWVANSVNQEAFDIHTWSVPDDDYDLVLLFSDGIESFVDATGSAIGVESVLDEFCNFKGFAGEFIQRRANAFLKDCALRGWKHQDDLAVAGIYLGDAAP